MRMEETGLPRRKRQKRGGAGKIVWVVILVAALWGAAFWGMRTLIHRRAETVTGGPINGRYDIDGYTAYAFESADRGAMVLGGDTRYPFTYTLEDGTLVLDFDDDTVEDAVFAYRLEGNVLTLTEGDEVYVLKKQ